MARKGVLAVLGAAAALHLFLGLSFIRSAAATYDEAVHLASGYSYWKTGRYRLNIMDHPPLAEMLSAVPAVFLGPSLLTGHPDWSAMRLYHYADAFLFKNTVDAERLLNSGRIFLYLLLSGLLLGALFLWGRRLGGEEAGVAAVFAAALSPVVVSNLPLAATDGTSSVFFFLAFWLLSFEKKSRGVWAAAGFCAGLALASKFNMIVLFPLAGGMLALDSYLAGKNRPKFSWEGAGLALACVAAAVVLVYRVGEVPYYLKGLAATLKRLDQGRSAFLHGKHSVTGFAAYFPVALALKTPLPVLGLAAAGFWVWLKNRSRAGLWACLPALGYFAAALTAKVQIGVRHLLPIFPFLALAAGCSAAALWNSGAKKRAAAAALGVWALVSVLSAHPHQLAYFNELIGGSKNGYRWLVDSSLDWGQDLKGLAEVLKERGSPPVYLAYFGSADPDYYGIRYVPAGMCCNVTRAGGEADPAAEGKVLFAVSATNLQAVYFREKGLFSWLKEREPETVIGHSIFLYDLTRDAEGRRALSRLVLLGGGGPSRARALLLK